MQEIIEAESGAPLSEHAARALTDVLRRTRMPSAASGTFTPRNLTVLIADLRGFTAFSERYPAHVVLDVLNDFLVKMSEVVAHNGGRIEKFMGDSIMALFGLPEAHAHDAQRAVTCALEMQRTLDGLNASLEGLPAPKLFMGIGISSGLAMTGTLGCEIFSEHAVIGDDVNLAARIEAVSLRGQVLISDSTFALCGNFVQTGDPVTVYVKGKARPVTIHEVTAIPTLGLKARRNDLRASPRVNVKLPFTYHLVKNKVVMSEPLEGMMLDLGYHGAALRVGQEYPPHTEIKLSFTIPLIGADASDIYARVIRTRRDDGQYTSGVEFTTIGDEASAHVQQFVHYLLQSDPELKKGLPDR